MTQCNIVLTLALCAKDPHGAVKEKTFSILGSVERGFQGFDWLAVGAQWLVLNGDRPEHGRKTYRATDREVKAAFHLRIIKKEGGNFLLFFLSYFFACETF